MVMALEVLWSPIHLIGDIYDEDGVFNGRDTIGTAFCLHVPGETDPEIRHGYIVTADHVIRKHTNITMRPARHDGTLHMEIPLVDWCTPNPLLDLAVCPTRALPDGEKYWANPIELAVPVGAITTVLPADPVYYIGVFVPLDRMMVRSGTIGAVDQFGGLKPPYAYPYHLVDCRSYGGFSGSPCFVGKEYPDLRPSAWPLPEPFSPPTDLMGTMAYVVLFAGMFTAHYTDDDEEEPGKVTSKYGVGVMLRSQEIREALMSEKMRKARREREEEIRAKHPKEAGPKLKETGASIKSTGDLLGDLFHVPKDEADGVHKDH